MKQNQLSFKLDNYVTILFTQSPSKIIFDLFCFSCETSFLLLFLISGQDLSEIKMKKVMSFQKLKYQRQTWNIYIQYSASFISIEESTQSEEMSIELLLKKYNNRVRQFLGSWKYLIPMCQEVKKYHSASNTEVSFQSHLCLIHDTSLFTNKCLRHVSDGFLKVHKNIQWVSQMICSMLNEQSISPQNPNQPANKNLPTHLPQTEKQIAWLLNPTHALRFQS